MEYVKLVLMVVGILILAYFPAAGVYWVLLWSFGFPIMFSWKAVVGFMILASMLQVRYNND